MPRHRGVEMRVVSQFEAMSLPEYSLTDTDDQLANEVPTAAKPDSSNTVSVYIPVYRGAQFWFEYSVDGPHPPEAIYFFKMTYQNQTITSWDTTQKAGFCGKAVVALQYIGNDPFTGHPVIQRNVFQFSTPPADVLDALDDFIEVCMYRVEHRRRVKLEASQTGETDIIANEANAAVKLQNGGVLAATTPKKFYKYQLLDPLDAPHVCFRFYMRTADQLNELGIIQAKPAALSMTSYSPSTSSSSTTDAHDDTDATSASHRSSLDSLTPKNPVTYASIPIPNIKPAPLTLSLDGVEFDISSIHNNAAAKQISPPTAPAHVTTFLGLADDDGVVGEVGLDDKKKQNNNNNNKSSSSVIVIKNNKTKAARWTYQKSSKAARAGAAMLLGGLIERAKGRKGRGGANGQGP